MDINQLFNLLNLSAPGLNRPIGSGDIVSYAGGRTPGAPGMTSDVQTAQPGASFAPPGAAPFLPGSMLASLASFIPAIAQAQQGIGNANVQSGQGNALPSTYAATPGIGSTDVNNVLAAVNAPSGGGVLPTNVQPVGGPTASAPTAPAPSTTAAAPTGGGDAGGTAGAGPGSPGGPGGPGAPGTPGGPGDGSAPGSGPGDGGGAGAGAGGGSTVLCSYTINRIELAPRERRIVLGWWARTRNHLLDQERGERDFESYTATATRVTELIDTVTPELRAAVLAWLKTILVDPVLQNHSWSAERAESGLSVLGTTAVLLAHACHVAVPEHAQILADLRELLSSFPLPEPEARERLLTGAGA